MDVCGACIAIIAYTLYLNIYTLEGLSSSDANTLVVAGGIILVIGVVLIAVFNVTTLIRGLNGALGRTKSIKARSTNTISLTCLYISQ